MAYLMEIADEGKRRGAGRVLADLSIETKDIIDDEKKEEHSQVQHLFLLATHPSLLLFLLINPRRKHVLSIGKCVSHSSTLCAHKTGKIKQHGDWKNGTGDRNYNLWLVDHLLIKIIRDINPGRRKKR